MNRWHRVVTKGKPVLEGPLFPKAPSERMFNNALGTTTPHLYLHCSHTQRRTEMQNVEDRRLRTLKNEGITVPRESWNTQQTIQ